MMEISGGMTLFVISLLFVAAVSARPRAGFDEDKLNDIRQLFERYSLAFRDPVCPIYAAFLSIEAWSRTDLTKCSPPLHTCDTDAECQQGLKCCFDGCFYTCAAPININRLKGVDGFAVGKPSSVEGHMETDFDNEGEVGRDIAPSTECSTTNSLDFQPLLCPGDYECHIEAPQDLSLGLPNRGVCVKAKSKVQSNYVDQPGRTDCDYKGTTLSNGAFVTEGCRFCFCDRGITRCQLDRCAPGTTRGEKTASGSVN